MVFRVRHGDGDYLPVNIRPGDSEQGIKQVVAATVGLPVETFVIQDQLGVKATFHGDLDGDWDVVLLPVQAPPARAVAGPAGECA